MNKPASQLPHSLLRQRRLLEPAIKLLVKEINESSHPSAWLKRMPSHYLQRDGSLHWFFSFNSELAEYPWHLKLSRLARWYAPDERGPLTFVWRRLPIDFFPSRPAGPRGQFFVRIDAPDIITTQQILDQTSEFRRVYRDFNIRCATTDAFNGGPAIFAAYLKKLGINT